MEAPKELSGLLKDAMQYGQDGKPIIHMVQIMEGVKRPFFMFICSNCYCAVCDIIRDLGYWSPVETLIFHYVLRRSRGCKNGKALVVDVGAHVGYFSLISASYGCRVVSFEPNSEAIRYLNLSRVVNNYKQITLHQKGVGQVDTETIFKHIDTWALNGFVKKQRKLMSDGSTWNVNDKLVELENHIDSPHMNSQNLKRGFDRRQVLDTIEVTMLDSTIEGKVLLLKIDTKGSEANVITGAKDLINQLNVHHILIQVKDATSPAKRGLLWTIAKTGAYTYVYNWEEIVTPLLDVSFQFRHFQLSNATIFNVADIIHNQTSTAPLLYQGFWFCRQPLL